MAGLMTAEEIKEIRGLYGLTQKSFAQLLGIGAASIVRYEQGAEPSKANANLIRAARHPEFMLECIERDGGLIPEHQRERATRCVYAAVSLEPGEADAIRQEAAEREAAEAARTASTPSMDEVYHYTIQQEVLDEQAANIACGFMEYLIANAVDINDSSHPVALLLRQMLQLKKSLLNSGSDDDVVLEQIRGHLRYMDEFICQLNSAEKAV